MRVEVIRAFRGYRVGRVLNNVSRLFGNQLIRAKYAVELKDEPELEPEPVLTVAEPVQDSGNVDDAEEPEEAPKPRRGRPPKVKDET